MMWLTLIYFLIGFVTTFVVRDIKGDIMIAEAVLLIIAWPLFLLHYLLQKRI